MPIKLDKYQRMMSERVLQRIASNESALEDVVYALVAAEGALAIKGSYRAPEQKVIQSILDEVRRVIDSQPVPYDGVSNKAQYEAEAAHAELAAGDQP